MSHFTVLIIGENIEEQLQPFHEFECTGTNDEYVKTKDVTTERKEEYDNYKKEGQSFKDYLINEGINPVEFGCNPNICDEHKYSYFRLDKYGEVDGVFRRTNPNKKWDWWAIGGRWTGFFDL